MTHAPQIILWRSLKPTVKSIIRNYDSFSEHEPRLLKESTMEITTDILVRYAETDKMGVVYHANYLVYLEVARTEYLEQLGFPYKEIEASGYMSPVLECNVSYGKPFVYGDTVVVYTSVTKVTSVKTQYSYRLYAKGEDPSQVRPHATATTWHCLVDSTTFKPISQKKHFPKLYDAYIKAAEITE